MYWDNFNIMMGLYRDNGKENGNYHSIIRWFIGVVASLGV